MKKRIIITFAVDNTIDLITNSSSELFVLSGDTREIVTEMVESVYPEFRNEYAEIKSSRDLSEEELDYFFSFASSPGCWPASKNQYPIIPGFTFEDLYEPEDKDPAWNGEIQYQLKNNKNETEDVWDRSFVTNENHQEILNKLDPEGKMYFLYSLDENPNWDMQEALMNIGVRYHLG